MGAQVLGFSAACGVKILPDLPQYLVWLMLRQIKNLRVMQRALPDFEFFLSGFEKKNLHPTLLASAEHRASNTREVSSANNALQLFMLNTNINASYGAISLIWKLS
jgi:hypothetical protein